MTSPYYYLRTAVQERNRCGRGLPDAKSAKLSKYQMTVVKALLDGGLESLGSTERTQHGPNHLEAARVLEAFADMIRERPTMLADILAGKTRVETTPADNASAPTKL